MPIAGGENTAATFGTGPLGAPAPLPPRIETPVHPELGWLRFLSPERRWVRGDSYLRTKRILDVGTVVLLAPLWVPVLAVCCLAVKLESPRAPSIFVQPRTGRGGSRFRMFKLRTMVRDAETLKPQLAEQSRLQWPDFKVENDPRVTWIGRLLRRSSLDELPQVWNVLRGEMSLVGPRPTSFGVETYAEWHKARLSVTPGLTGLWQIVGRGEMEFDDRVVLDLEYIRRQSLALDLLILLRTARAVAVRKGVY